MMSLALIKFDFINKILNYRFLRKLKLKNTSQIKKTEEIRSNIYKSNCSQSLLNIQVFYLRIYNSDINKVNS